MDRAVATEADMHWRRIPTPRTNSWGKHLGDMASMGDDMNVRILLALLSLGVSIGALGQQQVSAPADGGSAPTRTTAPTSATKRMLDSARKEEGATKQNVPTPQVAVPLRRTATDPKALKPGKRERAAGSVDESAARCQAEQASGLRGDCGPK